MHSLETINRLNNESHEKWVAKQAQRTLKTKGAEAISGQGFLIFSIKQAIELAASNEEITTLLGVALRLAEDT